MNDVKPLPNLTAQEAVAWFESQGFRCDRSVDAVPVSFGCTMALPPGVEAMGVNITTDGANVALGLNAYVVAPTRSDFDNYANSFFSNVVLPAVLDEADTPALAPQGSGTILVGDYWLAFSESVTSRTMHVYYVGP